MQNMATHKDKEYYSKEKFTPTIIHNAIEVDIDSVKDYFYSNHTLQDCADRFGCSKATIKRKLRAAGVDTSRYNHSAVAKERSLEATRVKLPTDEELQYMLVDRNLDSKTVAELTGVHYNTIRNRARKLNIKKTLKDVSRSMMSRHHRMHGCAHPSQRADVLAKTRKSSQRAIYRNINFRSLHELSYALFLDSIDIEWVYEEMRIPYVDMLSGKSRVYVIDFTVIDNDDVWWIEIKPADNMIPDDKRIYASRRAEEAGVLYRGVTMIERQLGWSLLVSGFKSDEIEYTIQTPRSSARKLTYYFKNRDVANSFRLDGWTKITIVEYGKSLYALKMGRT
jgi:hypothetical protein